MNNNLKILLDQQVRFEEDEIDFSLFDKIEGCQDYRPGDKVKIYWKKEIQEHCDEGFIFVLPGQDPQEWDMNVHIFQSIEEGPEDLFYHIHTLVLNEDILKIEIYKS